MNLRAGFFAQFDVPIREVEEVFPAIVVGDAEIDLDEWTPLRPFRLADQAQAGFVRRAVGLVRVALDAGANNVLPSGRSAAITRNYVVEVQVFALENLSAVLAGVLVPLEDIVPGELHLFLGHAVEQHQHDDAGHADAE
jgi:hypothetical protein